jgi:uncharacterized membrane protein YdbT with pleckstrin-like domain
MAQSYLESMLGDREQIIHTARQHWFILISSITVEVVLILIFLAAMVISATMFPAFAPITIVVGFVLILIPFVTMMRDILTYTNHRYVVTNRRVIQLSGILDKTVTDSSLEKVNDVKMTQSALGRIFDFGDIEILTASELGVNQFKRIEKPVSFKTAMINAKERLESGEGQTHSDIRGPGTVEPGKAQSLPELLAQLEALRQQGILTQAEFEAKKAQILSRL